MRPITVVFENTKSREVVHVTSHAKWQSLATKVYRWMGAAVEAVEHTGLCKSFSVTVHTGGPDCDHEVKDAGAK